MSVLALSVSHGGDVRSAVPVRPLWDSVAKGLPSGRVMFMFTDIEGSTSLWESAPEAMRVALERHDRALCSAIGAHGGLVFSTGGDGLAAAFARSIDAVVAAAEAQATLAAEACPQLMSWR
jgi:class 3 adenylate cyclase